MEFHSVQTVKHPLPTVWATMRDQLPEIASQQADIDYVKVEKRSKKGTTSVHVLSTWKSNPPLPSMIKNFIKPEMLIWTDDALWDNASTICQFTITTHYKVEEIACTGSIIFEAAGSKSTKITYSGAFTITKTKKSSIFMTGLVIKGIETVARTIIENNFNRVVKAMVANIEAS